MSSPSRSNTRDILLLSSFAWVISAYLSVQRKATGYLRGRFLALIFCRRFSMQRCMRIGSIMGSIGLEKNINMRVKIILIILLLIFALLYGMFGMWVSIFPS